MSQPHYTGATVGGVTVEDADVVGERYRVENLFQEGSGYDQEALVVREMRKHFGKFAAVNGLSFGVHNQVLILTIFLMVSNGLMSMCRNVSVCLVLTVLEKRPLSEC